MTESKTPRTDDIEVTAYYAEDMGTKIVEFDDYIAMTEHAQQLESENADVRDDIERHVAALSAEMTESERLRQQLAEERKAREEAELDKAGYLAEVRALLQRWLRRTPSA